MEHRRVCVLAEDPDLGSGLEPSQVGLARRRAVARAHLLARGPWAPPEVPGVDPQHAMGLLVIEGLLTREIQLAGRRSLELLGCGDVLRPWQPDNDEYAIVPSEAQWTVVEPARIAVLDRHFEQAVAGWPEIVAALMGRVTQRSRSLTVRLAIAQIPQLSSRLLMLWHLADRSGRVGQGGVTLPLRLSHGMLADLVSARSARR